MDNGKNGEPVIKFECSYNTWMNENPVGHCGVDTQPLPLIKE